MSTRNGGNRQPARRRGLTLVEAALVTGLTGLLAAVLLPALGTAREQARVRQCLANMRVLGTASNAYLAEFSSLSFALGNPHGDVQSYNYSLFTEYVALGAMPDKTLAQMQAAGISTQISGADVYNVPARLRPMNRYVDASVWWSRPLTDRIRLPAEVPGFFRCPSDFATEVPGQAQNLPLRDWEWWGTSYPINWWWPYYYSTQGAQFLNVLGAGSGPGRGPQLMSETTGDHASQFVIFMENQLNVALSGGRPEGYTGGPWPNDPFQVDGWHGRFSYHSATFRDGSARYQEFDTRYNNGDGWTVWPKRPWLPPWDAYDGIDP